MTDAGHHPPADLAQPAPAGPIEVVAGLAKVYRKWLVGIGFVVAFVLVLLWGANRPAKPTFANPSSSRTTTPAGPAFADKKVGVDSSCLHVLVAATPEQRAEGLRNRDNLNGYDGMIFEFGQPMNHEKTRFTMSDVQFPLTVGFYNQSGLRVDATDMALCSGSTSCPSYRAKDNFNTAIETPKGKLPDGPLTACPA